MTNLIQKLGKIDKKERTKLLLSMIFDVLTFILVTISVVSFLTEGGEGNMTSGGTSCFRYFTIDSNILAALCCLLHAAFTLRFVLLDKPVPFFVSVLKFAGTAAVTLTFLTVVLFLGPIMGYGMMFAGVVLFLHLICPVLCFVSFCFFDEKQKMPPRFDLIGVIPAFVYGTLYMTMVIFVGQSAGGWEDFYHFNIGGFWYLTFVVMMIATYLISFAILKLQKLSSRKK